MSKKTSFGTKFLTENTSLKNSLEMEQRKLFSATAEEKKIIERNILNIKSGIEGESLIERELNYSGLDLYVLPDIHLENNGIKAQIDFVVVARKKIYLIESKHMYGNVEVKRDGTFVRKYTYNGQTIEEAMYSPIRQCQRHLDVVYELRLANIGNKIMQKFAEKTVKNQHQSIVVIASPKTIISFENGTDSVIVDNTIRADNLVSYIKEQEREDRKNSESSDEEMATHAKFFLYHNKNNNKIVDEYLNPIMIVRKEEPEPTVNTPIVNTPTKNSTDDERICKLCGSKMKLIKGARGSFYGCTNYDYKTKSGCKYTESLEPPKPTPVANKESIQYYKENQVNCPKCGQPLVVRTSKKKDAKHKEFVGCSTFPKCRYNKFFD